MMALLHSFSSLTLICVLLLTLLPEGSLRRTASMVVGLLMLLMWSEGLTSLLSLPDALDAPASPLVSTGARLEASEASARHALAAMWEESP